MADARDGYLAVTGVYAGSNGGGRAFGVMYSALLVLALASALAAVWLWWHGRRLAAPLSLGVGLATLYYAVASVLGPDYRRYEGNNERFFLLFLALIVLSWTLAARAWNAL